MSASKPETATKDRRRSVRVQHAVDAYIISPTARSIDERKPVTAMNVSRHGVAFEFVESLPRGTYYMIELVIGEEKMRSEIRIIACRELAGGGYEIGAAFC